MSPATPKRSVRWPALDGLRGVAILLVLAYHAWPDAVIGGAHGVTLFFVLSGFLITGVVLRDGPGWVFYRRRLVRLVPALVITSALFLALGGSWSSTWPALTYLSNLRLIGGQDLGGFEHTWSLSVEEHFYLLWPLILTVIPARRRVTYTAALLAAAIGWRLALMGADWERIYYGTDTTAFAILAGCLIAVAPIRGGKPVWAVAGIALLSVVTATHTHGYLWATFAVAGLAAVAVSGARRPTRLLEWAPLRGLGTISYGLYLIHPIVFAFPMPRSIAVAVAIGVATLMWRTIEQPILRAQRRSVPVGDQPGDTEDGEDTGNRSEPLHSGHGGERR